MIGIILIGHAHIASETKNAVEHILKDQQMFQAVNCINLNETEAQTESLSNLIHDMMKSCDDGILMMADILGATPCNIALKAITRAQAASRVELVVGFNLPCVIKAINKRALNTLPDLANLCLVAGQKYMFTASQNSVVQQMLKLNQSS